MVEKLLKVNGNMVIRISPLLFTLFIFNCERGNKNITEINLSPQELEILTLMDTTLIKENNIAIFIYRSYQDSLNRAKIVYSAFFDSTLQLRSTYSNIYFYNPNIEVSYSIPFYYFSDSIFGLFTKFKNFKYTTTTYRKALIKSFFSFNNFSLIGNYIVKESLFILKSDTSLHLKIAYPKINNFLIFYYRSNYLYNSKNELIDSFTSIENNIGKSYFWIGQNGKIERDSFAIKNAFGKIDRFSVSNYFYNSEDYLSSITTNFTSPGEKNVEVTSFNNHGDLVSYISYFSDSNFKAKSENEKIQIQYLPDKTILAKYYGMDLLSELAGGHKNPRNKNKISLQYCDSIVLKSIKRR